MYLSVPKVPYQGKKVGEKWLNFLQGTKFLFFPTSIFPRFFSPVKGFIPIFLIPNYYYYFSFICKIYYYHFFFFFWCTLSILNKNFDIRVKAKNWKNNCNNINTTRNCTFVHFKNYATFKTSKKIGLKLVLIISRSKKRVMTM